MQSNDLNEIVVHYAGSKAYGTDLPTSDTDIRGVFCAYPVNIRTPFFPVREVTLQDEEDGKLYELSNFIHLYTQCNPNIVETLWVDESDIISSSKAYKTLTQYREALLSAKVAFTFSGFAVSQLKRIKGHNKWINNPQSKEPSKHGCFLKLVQNFSDEKLLPRDFTLNHLKGFGIVHYGSGIFGAVEGGGVDSIVNNDFNISAKQVDFCDRDKVKKPIFIFKYLADEYRASKEKHHNYWTWKNNRNIVRSSLEEEFGYDTKHAMHLVRLLRMGEEILSGKGVIVKRPDAKELLDIRKGSWSYEELVDYAETKDELIRGELYNNTSLPKTPNLKLAAKVVMAAQDICWGQ